VLCSILPSIATRHSSLVGKNVHDPAERLADFDPSEIRSNLEQCRRSVIIEDKTGKLIDLYQLLIDHGA